MGLPRSVAAWSCQVHGARSDANAGDDQPRSGLPTVILLHGFLGRRGDMNYMMRSISSAGFNAIALDLPGHGDAGAPDVRCA
eukprot:6209514-Pleurochrysis_carterae.AAC.2